MFDAKSEGIPKGLDRMKPGPILAAYLSSINVEEISGYDRIPVLRAHQRMASHYQAHLYRDMAAVVDVMDDFDDIETAIESATAEIRVALRLTRRAADSEVAFASDLRQRLPQLWDRMVSGDVDLRRAKTITYGTTHLSQETARSVVDDILDDAPGLTTGQLAAKIRRLCIEVAPDEAKERFEDAVDQRRVVVQPTEAGTIHLYGFDLPPVKVASAATRINRLALSLKTASESRSMDQLRADVFLDLLLGANAHSRSNRGGRAEGAVNITVDLQTLAELVDHPGELAGYGPVIADIARQVTEQNDGQWRYTITHPHTGMPIHHGTTRRRPTTGMRRRIEAQHPTCVFPGCRMPSENCDLDHRIPWSQGGPTHTGYLAPQCRFDHHTRHKYDWTYQPLPGGDYLWTTRLGHTYTTSGKPP